MLSADTHLAARVCQVSDYVQVSTAAPSRDVAVELAQQAVGRRLAAGAQIVGPVTSVFWHLGEQGMGEEWQVLLYTTLARYPDLEACLHQAHPWTSPQVTAVPVVKGATGYLNWVSRTVDDA
ncbi:divalent-cation tolerance protein CutA [Salinispora arenicola]|uniref:divalent-cation tolerance protein CutA n=1 Tax=Salinispora arenicola TaxID=168697 RepID=UPI000375F6E8|nr:divalent-cation tolerance protein CutA [Salinispora arenicola]MCN0180785.1 divalent-cation tolerance protein CutA [Salinispora arenicola]NIL43788.1 divalent-cation tolerance protein CutA [Salinispora arenicola]NIL57946.1 divalent-cation tolerance protein CutA [Salinispora arenicola]NIL63602.1 divalent-cation tolerance protein CutA [Salinispora arenicola]